MRSTFRIRRAFDRIGKEAPLQLSFEKFHQLLEYNNRVLEIIAEMEEMLNGEYLFDKNYLHAVSEELSTVISKVVYSLNVIGQGKYIELFEIAERIKRGIEADVSDRLFTAEGDYVARFEHLDRAKSNLAGGKAASLGELRSRLKICTTPGFVITTRAYHQFLDANSIRGEIESYLGAVRQSGAPLEEMSARIERLIVGGEMPCDIVQMIDEALDAVENAWKQRDVRYAVRSSAVGEDMQLSFAGQYSTFLNVPRPEITQYYKRVVASLFSSNALSYREKKGVLHVPTPMAVAVMPMLDPLCAGILYSVDPNSPESDNMVISAVWGLGQMIAEGEGKSDYFVVSRKRPHDVVQRSIARKREAHTPSASGGVARTIVGEERQAQPCLSNELISQLAELGLRIERYFDQPQDIEWAVENDGTVYVLQARPLLISDDPVPEGPATSPVDASYPVLMRGKGAIACRGVGAGKAYRVFPDDSGTGFPQGAVLVARSTSPRLSQLIVRASAVVTDIGTPTGHMATIAREFRVPMLVDTGMATRLIPDGAEVTVDANKNIVYRGVIPELVRTTRFRVDPLQASPEFCKLRNMLKHVAPLHLVDPRDKIRFRASNCSTYHDIIRFSHEMVAKELIEMHLVGKRYKETSARRLRCEIPIGLILIDVGNGLRTKGRRPVAEVEDINCVPLRLVLEGLLAPGTWSTRPVPLSFRDFMSGIGHTIDPTLSQPEYGSRSLAIVSNTYLNLGLRFGYHFNMVDCVASEQRSANYIYFRFVGGITEMARRKRRALFLSNVLKRYDFTVELRGDLVIGRITKVSLPMMEERLRMVGRLVGFSRQLDIYLKSDESVGYYTREFLKGVEHES